MSTIYVKRGAVVRAEPFDPARTDQGVSVNPDTGAVVMTARGRLVNVRAGDILVTDDRGPYPCDAVSFAALFERLDDVVTFETPAVTLAPEGVAP